MSDEREVQELLRRALASIANLRACAERTHRYNKVTRNEAAAVLSAISAALQTPVVRGCFVVIEPCNGYRSSCRCGWEQHYRSKFTAREDAFEHERNQPDDSGEAPEAVRR